MMFIQFIFTTLTTLFCPEVNSLEAQLSNTIWQTREQAETYLVFMGFSKFPQYKDIRDILNQSDSPEVRYRAYWADRRINALRISNAVHTANTRWSDYPCLDSMWYNINTRCYLDASDFGYATNAFRELTYNYMHKAFKLPKLDPLDTREYALYRVATKELVIDMLLNEVDVQVIDEFLLRLHSVDRHMYKARNLKWYTSPEIMAKLGVGPLEGYDVVQVIPDEMPP